MTDLPPHKPGRVYGVTGCAGFLGSHLVDHLLRAGHKVIGVDNLAYGLRENLAQHDDNPLLDFHVADVTDRGAMRELLAPCDALVHLAAHKIPRYGSALQTLLVNADGTRNVLDAAAARAARGLHTRVALASTSDVYGKSDALPFHEDGDLVLGPSHVPRWSYAVSKLYDEHLAFAYSDEHKLPIALMRFFGSYGPRHHLSWWGGPQSVFLTALMTGEPITLHGDGLQTRTFTYAEDTVRGILACADRHEAGCEVYNIASLSSEISIKDFALLIHRLAREECPDLPIPDEPPLAFIPYAAFSSKPYEDVRRRVPDIQKARERLGFEPNVSLEDGLRQTIRWHRAALARRGG